jgi:cellulose synthase/poly-beta-1,6-N-acetylglucosamine synthase-like glycosyltransferase
MLSITVLIPTYRRIADLERCLEALKRQERAPDEVLVTVRDIDTETWTFLREYHTQPLNLKILKVEVPGVIAAMNLALSSFTSDIIASTDDDASPHPDWLLRMEEWFLSDPKIGGVGGRDWQYVGDRIKEPGEREIVGQVQWFGRVIGNHHLGVGEAQEVDVLKGVNMAFRRSAIGDLTFDERLQGSGAQVHFELAFTLKLRRQGWKLIYDPKVAVDHYPAQRFDEDGRDQFNPIAQCNTVHNETLALLDYLSGIQQPVFLLWSILIGTRGSMGLLQWLRFVMSDRTSSGENLRSTLRGRWAGWQTWKRLKSSPNFKVPVGATK